MGRSRSRWTSAPSHIVTLVFFSAIICAPSVIRAEAFFTEYAHALSKSQALYADTDEAPDDQPVDETSPPREGRSIPGHVFGFFGNLGYDYSVQAKYPFQYSRDNPGRVVLGLAGLTALVSSDHRTTAALAPRDKLADRGLMEPARRISEAVNGKTMLALFGAFGAYGVVMDSPRERSTAGMIAEAAITSSTWTFLLKGMTGRQRPREVEDGSSSWAGPDEPWEIVHPDDGDNRSFPSGHATGTWAAATVLANQYPKYYVVPVLAYGTAVAVSYSRMALGAHWLSDVLVGGLIGHGCAKQVLAAHRGRKTQEPPPQLQVGFDLSRDYQGVNIRYNFR
jgi:membrane-associated phospholipid phosphatase